MLNKRATSRKVWADCVYQLAANILEVEKKKWGPLICEKGYRNHLLIDAKKQENPGFVVKSNMFWPDEQSCPRKLHDLYRRPCSRESEICFKNLSYNMLRLTILTRPTGNSAPAERKCTKSP
ncbi:MAG: hypothetical protein Q4D62_09855 [Planctomycetia bacterium]|nr:hypothetical protein [Planctomycetia bacterium]